MASDDLKTALGEVRQALLAEQEQGPSDRELLTRFVERRDEDAFAALVRRHAAMVWGVCRRTLRNAADAEDAFQATFLVLVRKAASVQPRETVGNFLYGVARRTALKARTAEARRWRRERQVEPMPQAEAKGCQRDDELQALLDEELARLPDKYRAVLVLCDLEGQARSVAARHLGLPEGTVASRLARARAMLARRLARRGLGVTGASLAAALSAEAMASAPAAAVSAAIRAACALAAGQAGAAAVSAKVLSLTEGVVKAMFVTRLMKATAMVLALGTAIVACGVLAPGRSGEPSRTGPDAPPLAAPPAAKAEPADPLPTGAVAQFGSLRLQDIDDTQSAAISPDGKRMAVCGHHRPLLVWDVRTGELARTYPNPGWIPALHWEPDGKLAALSLGMGGFFMREFSDNPASPPGGFAGFRLLHADKAQEYGQESCFLSADGRWVVVIWTSRAKKDRRAALYRFTTARKPERTPDSAKPECEIDLPPGSGAWLSADGKCLLAHVSSSTDTPNRLRAFAVAADEKGRAGWELAFPGADAERRPAACFSPDGQRVVVSFWDGSVELWDGPAGKRVRELAKWPVDPNRRFSVEPSIDLGPDGKRLVLIHREANGQVGGRVVDVATGRNVCRLAPRAMPRPGGAGIARFSADGQWVARVSRGVVGVWNAQTGADACPLPGHRGLVTSLAVLASGGRVVTTGDDFTARAWDPATGKEAWRAALPQAMHVKFATPDGVVVLQYQEAPYHRLQGPPLCLDAATGQPRPLPGDLAEAGKENFLACSPDGTTVVTLDAKWTAFRVWSWPAGRLQKTVPLVMPDKFELNQCAEARFIPDGKHFVAVLYCIGPGEQPGQRQLINHPFVETWDLAAGKRLGRMELERWYRHPPGRVSKDTVFYDWDTESHPLLMPHPTGLYYSGNDGEVRDAMTGRLLVRLERPEVRGLDPNFPHSSVGVGPARGPRFPEGRRLIPDFTRAALAPDGRTVAVCPGELHEPVLLFETRTGRLRGTLPVPGGTVTGLSFLPDGRLIVLGTTATVWSVALHPAAVPAADLDWEWEKLGEADAEKAWPAMAKLAASPGETVERIGRRVRPVPTEATLVRLCRNLDAEEFRDREMASQELDRLGVLAVPRVKARLAAVASEEVKRRLGLFLEKYERENLAAVELRALRAVEILEAIRTPAARKLLGELAAGEPTARLTQDAAAAVQRLAGR
jgi:RNA polymerase sigma factor (sigma-70 family)